jgi:hypothetical protein
MMERKHIDPADAAKIELRPDGYERFRQAVHAAAESGPKHRTKDDPPKRSVVKDTGKR